MAKSVKRKAWLTKGKGKLRGRHCVNVQADKAPRSAVKGVEMMAVQRRGCFVSKAKAQAKANQLAHMVKLPKGRKSRRRSRR